MSKVKVDKQEIVSQVMEDFCDNKMETHLISYIIDAMLEEATDKQVEEIVDGIDRDDFQLNIRENYFKRLSDEDLLDDFYDTLEKRGLLPDMVSKIEES